MVEEFMKDEFDSDFSLFIEAGFVAVRQLDEQGARQCFHAAQVIRPDDPTPMIGLGYIALNKLEIKEAADAFTKVVEKYPEHHLAQTFLGMTYLLSKNKKNEGKKLIKKVMRQTDDETVKNLGKISLDWCEKDIDAQKAPFFVPQEKNKKEGEEKE